MLYIYFPFYYAFRKRLNILFVLLLKRNAKHPEWRTNQEWQKHPDWRKNIEMRKHQEM